MNPEPLFHLRGIRYQYHTGFYALDGIDLDIYRGEHIALLGANGAGKSTLLKLLDGLVVPTEGTMRAMGIEIKSIVAGPNAFHFHREVGMVFQDPDIQLFNATVLDDVAFGPLQLGLTPGEVEERCNEAMGLMDVNHLATRAPFELSGGEKKRAAIASVLSLRPDVILLDEPTASLDPRTKWVLINLIHNLQDAGKTTITTTHELEIVPVIADRVIVLGENRRILAEGSPSQILSDHKLLVEANLIHEQLHEYAFHQHDKEMAEAALHEQLHHAQNPPLH